MVVWHGDRAVRRAGRGQRRPGTEPVVTGCDASAVVEIRQAIRRTLHPCPPRRSLGSSSSLQSHTIDRPRSARTPNPASEQAPSLLLLLPTLRPYGLSPPLSPLPAGLMVATSNPSPASQSYGFPTDLVLRPTTPPHLPPPSSLLRNPRLLMVLVYLGRARPHDPQPSPTLLPLRTLSSVIITAAARSAAASTRGHDTTLPASDTAKKRSSLSPAHASAGTSLPPSLPCPAA